MGKLIVALDLNEKEKIYELIEKIGDKVDFYKVGIISYLLFGDELIKYLKKEKKKIFLDLKFFDIPNTVENAVKIIFEKEIDMFTVHLMAGEKVIKSVVEAKKKFNSETKIIGVSILTSFKEEDLQIFGINTPVKKLVEKLAEYGYNWGIDGIVCSGEELELLRSRFKSPFLLITPGIRIEEKKDDQKRITTP
ncbi:MAG TPA: orotidine-5'-phosphate decarboxylase, partial [bacterium]|nr:orotidine-5'-phosphate decarboxylase [bacterium]